MTTTMTPLSPIVFFLTGGTVTIGATQSVAGAGMRHSARRARGDRDAVLVESAIVIPLFLALIFGFAEYTITEAGNSAGGNPVRDGARVGIINFANADQVGSANYNLIVAAVNSQLAGLVKGSPTVTVSCVAANGTTPLANGCDPAHVNIGSDMIQVKVQWTHISPVGILSNKLRTDQAVMKIVGAPGSSGTGGTSGSCTLSNPTANPSTVNATNGVLANPITFTVTVNSVDACGTPQLSLPSESGLPAVVNMTLLAPNSTTYQYLYPGDYTSDPNSAPLTQMWSPGTKTAQMQVQAGLKTTSTTFSVAAPTSSCTFGTVTPNPTVNVQLQNGNNTASEEHLLAHDLAAGQRHSGVRHTDVVRIRCDVAVERPTADDAERIEV